VSTACSLLKRLSKQNKEFHGNPVETDPPTIPPKFVTIQIQFNELQG
jgi:hypothetical protein